MCGVPCAFDELVRFGFTQVCRLTEGIHLNDAKEIAARVFQYNEIIPLFISPGIAAGPSLTRRSTSASLSVV